MSGGSKGFPVPQYLSRLAMGPTRPPPMGSGAPLEGKIDGDWH